ncbi:DUF1549 and DUF1553 domain-containing protein [Gemmata sp. JC673]|uniref:DUF1549 and DUF1553 domain-containing protein n=1 Tax=Gemmata algarum TaxID=2975278 RepID=A0ABU5F7U1_9BACT|nr:DUF1553 domain-containing protein [Gemmata algarum]MDY3563345.1 DUF1549 and DUF1553 domain-containing protein [Gemmata algarum]
MRPAVLAALTLLLSHGTGRAASPAELAARVDARIAARWKAEKVAPAVPATDAAFARRAYLDLVGRIPTVAEARAFIEDRGAGKRSALVAWLLASGGYARHWATFWRREWVPQSPAASGDEIEGWIAAQLRDNAPYDRVVRALLTAPAVRAPGGAPQTFLIASEFKPENLAANTTRAFLGINLDCAQCHNHPFARWTRDQFWETAAFFARPSEAGAEAQKIEIGVPGTGTKLGPQLLTGERVAWPAALAPDTGRGVLAAWVTKKDNPYFAKNAVNRVWAQLFGTGLVEPLDDLSGENPASHPELLDELATAFADSGFDLKHLTAALAQTRAYQLSSVAPAGGGSDPRLFARAAVRGLTGEQLYDSLRVAAGLPPDRTDLDPLNAAAARKRFAERFRVERAGTAQRSILQSLALMNGAVTAELTDPATSPALQAVAGAPFLDAAAKVEALYLAALGRTPTAEESAAAVKHLARGADAGPALADVLWALLNGSEFGTNH